MSKYTKAITAFLTGLIATLTGWAVTLQTDAPQATANAVAIIGAVTAFLSGIVVALSPKNAEA